MAAASYEWAVSVDGEDWTVVDTEDDATFGVTADLVGMYVKVTVTAEDGETASDATLFPVEAASGQIEITSAEAIAADKIAVTLAEPVDDDDTVITLTKGTDAFAIEAEWADTNDSVTLTTAAKLSKGTYTVTLTSIEDEDNTDSADVEVKDQTVTEIVILNDVALTNKAKDIAYAYYDVLDQYGESMRSSSSITWAGSCKITPNKTNGQLKLTKVADEDDWVYGEKIYVTGVNTKTGAATSKELTVGTEQNLDKIEMVGFVKKGTATIITAKEGLPKGFKEGEYYMLFNAYDQNGDKLAADDIDKEDVTFITSDPLIIKELTKINDPNAITIGGEEYNAVEVTPGIKVADGGEVTIDAIANKTGNKTSVVFNVGEDPVVATFTLSAPSATIADGDSIEIPFKAETADGKAVTSFRTIAKQKTFNTVTFNASDGDLDLVETDTGAAKLVWTDKTMPWSDAQTTDGIDRPVLLTVIVVGGDGSNERIDVQDKRRPDAIAAVKLDKVLVADATVTLSNTGSFQFYDQYGALIDDDGDATDYGDDNGFFTAAAAPYETLKGTGFAGYAFGVRVKNAGSGAIDPDFVEEHGWTAIAKNVDETTGDSDTYVIEGEQSVVFNTDPLIQSAQTNEGFKFEVAKIDTDDDDLDPTLSTDWEAVSSSKYFPTAVVPISQVKNLTIGALNTFYVGGLDVTGDKMISSERLTELKDTPLTVNTDGRAAGIYAGNTKTYDQNIIVKGTYNGNSVTVPAHYYEISANKLQATAGNTKGTGTERNFDAIIPYDEDAAPEGLQAADLYDKTTSKGVAKLATDEVTATVYDLHGEGDAPYFWAWSATKLASEKVNLTSTAAIEDQYDAAQATYSETNENNAKTALGADAAVAEVNTLVPEAAVTTTTVEAWIADNTDPTALDVDTAKQYVADKQTAYANKETALSAARGDMTKEQIAAADAVPADDEALAAMSDTQITEAVAAADAIVADDKVGAVAYLKAKRDALKAAAALTDAKDDLDKAVNNDAAVRATAAKTTAEGNVTAEFTAKKNANEAAQTTGITTLQSVYDTAKATITLSDQAPYAYEITGLAESYTFTPTLTKVTHANIAAKLKDVKVLDQYGVTYKELKDIDLTVSDVSENKDGWADNNFKVNENGTTKTNLEGAELGDTFTLVASYGELKESTAVTVGADVDARIHNSTNVFLDTLIGNGKDGALENQRLDGLK